MSLLNFNEDTIMELATANSHAKGVEYARRGAVRQLTSDGDCFRALVQGSYLYTVCLWEQDGVVASSCTCPYDWGGICKHVVAVMTRLLELQNSGQADINVQTSSGPDVANMSLSELLDSTTHFQLKIFMRQFADEHPQIIDKLRMFAESTAETVITKDGYRNEIFAALKTIRRKFEIAVIADPYFEYAEAPDQHMFLQEQLASFRDLATKYHIRENWPESAKIREALIHACGQIQQENQRIEEDEYDTGYGELFQYACFLEARAALMDWAALIPKLEHDQGRSEAIKRFVSLFISDDYGFGHLHWENAFRLAIHTRADAAIAINLLDAHNQEFDALSQAGILLYLLENSEDFDRFVRVAQTAAHKLPHWILPVVERMMALGHRSAAIQLTEEALAQKDSDSFRNFDPFELPTQAMPRQELLRFLIGIFDPQSERDKLRRHAEALFFESGTLPDYQFLRGLLTTSAEHRRLQQQVLKQCGPDTVVEVLSTEEHWDELLAYARQHVHVLPDHPQLLVHLHDRFPEDCFELYQDLAIEYLNEGTGQRLYDVVAMLVRHMLALPGQEARVGNFIVWIHDKFRRRTSLMRTLGDSIEIGFDMRNRHVQESRRPPTKEQAKSMSLFELGRFCPLPRTPTKQSDQNEQAAALIWAALLQHEEGWENEQLARAIAKELGVGLARARSLRAQGLRLLAFAGHVEFPRSGKRSRVALLRA